MMKRIVASLFFLLLFLAAAALVAPSFIDWGAHKDEILAQLKPYLGRQIDVGGQVKFRLVPNPQILLEDVTLSNAEGAKGDNFMKLKQLEASMKFQPLLQGRFEVDAINLEQPQLDFETLDDGSNNWTGILKQREEAPTLENAANTVQFNQITMTNGTLHYLNQVTGTEWQVDKLNLTVSAESLSGPYHVAGDMEYKGSQALLEASTGKFGGDAVPVHIAFNPTENLPQVKIDGTMDSQGGLNVKGDLFIRQGSVASLFDSDFVKNIAFLNDEADVSGSLDVKGGLAKIDDIKGKFGKKGELTGSVALAFEKGKKPALTADLSGNNLKVTSKTGFMSVPDGFDAHLKLKGRGITWNGIFLPATAVSTDTDKEEWVVRNGRFELPGKSVVKIAGVVTPKSKYAAYSIQVNSDDLPMLLKSLPLGDANFLKLIADSGLVKQVDWSSSLDVRPDNVSFSDIDAKIDDKMKLSGVLGVPLGGQGPAFKANLNFEDADMAAFDSDAWKNFTAATLKSDGDIDLTAKNLSSGDLKLADMSLAGKTGTSGLQIKTLTGTLADGGTFTVNGTIGALNPTSGLDVEYSLKAQNPGAVAKALGAELPPPMRNGTPVDIHGHINGDARKYTFNADGHGISLSGSAEAGADGTPMYQAKIHLDKPDNGGVFAMLGVPLDALIGMPKELSGELSGSRSNYKISKLEAGEASGTLARKEDKYSGDLTADTIDFDEWLSGGWDVKNDISLKLKAKKLHWRSDEVESPALTLDVDANSLHLTGLTGQMWGGNVTAEAQGERKDNVWNGSLHGNIQGANLDTLAGLMDLTGFAAGSGNLDFDLKSDGAEAAKEWFHGIDGTLKVKSNEFTVKSFAPGAVPEVVQSFTRKPEDFPAEITRALYSGDTKYDDVEASFQVADGKINIDRLRLSDASASVDVKGALDLSPDTYHLTAEVALKSPEAAPSFTVTRAGPVKNAPGYSVSTGALQEYLSKRSDKATVPTPLAPDEKQALPSETPKPAQQPSAFGPPQPKLQPKPETATPPAPDQQPVQLTPETPAATPEPPALPTPPETDSNGGRIDEPIETEPLAAPPVPPPAPAPAEAAPPPEPPAPAPGKGDSIKGILDRLNDGEQKPANTQETPAEDAPK